MIMARALPIEVTQGTLEGDIKPGSITLLPPPEHGRQQAESLHCTGRGASGCQDNAFWPIGVFAIPEMGRFYRHVLIEKNYPHHGAVAFGNYGKALFEVSQVHWRDVEEIGYNQPKSVRYKTENPFA